MVERPMKISLEYIESLDKVEIFGKAISSSEDVLLNFLNEETYRMTIGNYLLTVEQVAHRLTRNLSRYISAASINAAFTGVARPLAINETLRTLSGKRDAYSSAVKQPWEWATSEILSISSVSITSFSQSAMDSIEDRAGPSEFECPGKSGTKTEYLRKAKNRA